jgi:hypothetical protein
VNLERVENIIGPTRRHRRALAIKMGWGDQVKMRKPQVLHRSRDRPDVAAFPRLNENNVKEIVKGL